MTRKEMVTFWLGNEDAIAALFRNCCPPGGQSKHYEELLEGQLKSIKEGSPESTRRLSGQFVTQCKNVTVRESQDDGMLWTFTCPTIDLSMQQGPRKGVIFTLTNWKSNSALLSCLNAAKDELRFVSYSSGEASTDMNVSDLKKKISTTKKKKRQLAAV